MGLISWEDLNKLDIKEPAYLIDPYVVKEGITFLWAGTSTGKSPLTWAMAAAVGCGTNFFGLPAKQGKVLYLEVDSPESVLASRVRKTTAAPNVWFLTLKPLTVPDVRASEREALEAAQDEIKPDMVIVNTLRKVHRLDDKDSATPITVYGWFQHLFPQAALVFVHHTRKSSTDPRAISVEKEDFSGSMHFLDDSQVGLRLEPYDAASKTEQHNLNLLHKKSQVSPLLRPMPLLLDKDGTNLSCYLFDQLFFAYQYLVSGELSGSDLDQFLMDKLGVSAPTARRRRIEVEAGHFPGSRKFLERQEV